MNPERGWAAGGLNLIIYLIVVTIMASPLSCSAGPVREPAVAGAFYPADPKELTLMVDGFLKSADKPEVTGKLLALISPHAGYVYSGQVAAYSYKGLKDYDTVVLIGSAHRAMVKGAAVYAKGSFKTPLGLVRVDEARARALIKDAAMVKEDPAAHEGDHVIEVQLPFLQRTLKDFKVVPVLIGQPTKEMFAHLAEKLTEISAGGRVLIVASTDLSHYHAYDVANSMDRVMTEALERLSLSGAEEALGTGRGEMCGAYAVLLAMEVSRRLDATKGVLFKYANSGDVSYGDKDRVVGYAALGFYAEGLSMADKREIIELAKRAITEQVTHGKVSEVEVKNPRLRADGAVFVTINRKGRLRGCIGHVEPFEPLYMSILHNAANAAVRDPRFPPMGEAELGDMRIEVSILSPMKPIKVEEIVVGRHGLMIEKGRYRGLLLPQVPTEYGWDRETFLSQLAQKAGLPPEGWREGATLHGFTAEVIHDSDIK